MPIIYSKDAKMNTGINVNSKEIIGFLGDVPYGVQYFKAMELWELLQRDCGLLSYSDRVDTGIMYDKTGVTREAVQGETIKGDLLMYIKFTELANVNFSYIDATTQLTVSSSFDLNGEFIIPTNGVNDLQLTYNSIDYTLAPESIDYSDYKIPLVGSDNTVIWGQIMLPSANVTEVNNDVVSLADKQGFTVSKALGKNLFDGELELGVISITTGQNSPSSSQIRSKGFYSVESETEYTMQSFGALNTRYYEYDKDKNFLGSAFLGSSTYQFTTQKDTKFLRFVCTSTNTSELFQLELGSTPTTYEPYKGYFKDSLLTEPISQGTKILTGTDSKLLAYISDGQGGSIRPTAQASERGSVGESFRVVDGVVDVFGFEDLLNASGTIENNTLLFDYNIGSVDARSYETGAKPNTQYTMKYSVSDSTLTSVKVYISSSGISSSGLPLNYQNGNYTINFTTDSTIVDNFFRITNAIALASGDYAKYTIEKIYETALGEPPSQQLVVGNSIILNDRYNSIFTTDSNEILTDKANNVNKVYPITSDLIVESDQLFINATDDKIAYFDDTLTGDCLTKAKKLTGTEGV